jgi:dihydrofolate synthase/folylpolyglutamate synthase
LLDLPDGAQVLLDGAHNPAGAATLAQALDDLRPFLRGADVRQGRLVDAAPLTILTAMMADKDVSGAVAAFTSAASIAGARVIATQVEGLRAVPAEELAALWRRDDPRLTAEAIPDVDAALARALSVARGPMVVAGSLYLVGEVRRRLIDDPLLRDPPAGPS